MDLWDEYENDLIFGWIVIYNRVGWIEFFKYYILFDGDVMVVVFFGICVFVILVFLRFLFFYNC